jgi:hypothetical protein
LKYPTIGRLMASQEDFSNFWTYWHGIMKNWINEPGIRTELNMVDIIIMVLTVWTTCNIGCSQQFIWVVKLVLVSQRLWKFFVLYYLLPYINLEKGHMFS